MPEGDTVWLVAQRLHQALAGRVLTAADLRVPQLATAQLAGRTVTEVLARGKHLLTRISGDEGDDLTLHTHLRMDGRYRVYSPGQPWRGDPGHQVRVVLGNEEHVAVGFRVHDVELVPRAEEDRLVGHLGPDLLGPDWDEDEAVRRLRADPARPVGEAILDQRNLAGVGNMYKAEVLFLQGLHPWTPVSEVRDLPALVRRSQRVLEVNKHHPEQSTTGDTRRGQQHWVYLRAGQPCRRCGAHIVSAEQGAPPQQRLAFWCPRCQPGGPADT